MLDRNLVEAIADDLGAIPSFIEKDWHVVRALGVLALLKDSDVKPVFSGGTSLSKGWGLIRRFSEDIDFKVAMPRAASGAASGMRPSGRTIFFKGAHCRPLLLRNSPPLGCFFPN